MEAEICPMLPRHWAAVRAIYLEGISTGNATFETVAPEWEQWDRTHLASCRFVAISQSDVAGWGALSPVSKRAAYAGVSEVSVYVAQQYRAKGVGKQLLRALVAESERQNIWTLQAGIFPENAPSLELHRQAGFRVVGTRERLGCLGGRWRDVVLMERRSRVAG
jgi:phosphinothricin acetyltransferase